MRTLDPTSHMEYIDALEVFLGTDPSYGGGLSNHGPMAVEALVHLGVPEWIGPFVRSYQPRLERSRSQVEAAPADWRAWLQGALAPLASNASSLAGHGLLRVAHAIRALERTEDPQANRLQRVELATAVQYWRSGGPGIPVPQALRGSYEATTWLGTLGRLDPAKRSDGLLTETLMTAAATADFETKVASLAPASNPKSTLDALGIAAAAAFARNRDLGAFTLLHGTTVSAMASVLLPYLDDEASRRLEASVAAFVAAAIIAFDDGDAGLDAEPAMRLRDLPGVEKLAHDAGASLDDHTIKFVDACIAIAARTGNTAVLHAAHAQIVAPYGRSDG